MLPNKGPLTCYVTQWGGGASFPGNKHYESVRRGDVISVTRGWVSNFQEKARLEWLLYTNCD